MNDGFGFARDASNWFFDMLFKIKNTREEAKDPSFFTWL